MFVVCCLLFVVCCLFVRLRVCGLLAVGVSRLLDVCGLFTVCCSRCLFVV